MTEKWIPIDWDECPECGDDCEGLTDCDEAGFFYDGDSVRCVACGHEGYAVVEEDGIAWVNWP